MASPKRGGDSPRRRHRTRSGYLNNNLVPTNLTAVIQSMQNVIRDQDVVIQGLKEANLYHKQSAVRLEQVEYTAKATTVELFQVKRVCNEMTRQLMWLNMNMNVNGNMRGPPPTHAHNNNTNNGQRPQGYLPGPPRLTETGTSSPPPSSHARVPIPMFNSKSVTASRRRTETGADADAGGGDPFRDGARRL